MTPDAGNKLSSLLKKTRDPGFSSENSLENLVIFVQETEKILNVYCNDQLNFIYYGGLNEETKNTLNCLEGYLKRFGCFEAEGILKLIFQIGRDKITFSKQEKQETGSLMAGVINHINMFIRTYVNESRSNLDLFTLQLKSALQYMKDDYADFLVGHGKYFRELVGKMDSSSELLDSLISRWCDYKRDFEEEEDSTDDDTTNLDTTDAFTKDADALGEGTIDDFYFEEEPNGKDDLIDAGYLKVPQHHKWWEKYIQAYCDKVTIKELKHVEPNTCDTL